MEKNRQSKDFKEIWNVQSEMNVTSEDWDRLFHNWDNPAECPNNKKLLGCTVCDALRRGEIVIRPSTGEQYDKTGKLPSL